LPCYSPLLPVICCYTRLLVSLVLFLSALEMSKLPIARREKDTITEGDCVVCATKTLEFHFGAVCCVACGAFFRRSISDGKKYTCKGNNTCKILPGSRSSCRYCRLQRCVNAGMDPRAVQSAGSIQKSLPILKEEIPSSSAPPREKRNILKSFHFHYSSVLAARKVIYSKGSLQELLMGAELKPRKVHLFGRLDPSVLRFEQSLVILMLKNVKMFTDMSDDDQFTLLRSFCLNLSIIEKFYNTFKMDGIEKGHLYFSNFWYTDCHDSQIAPPEFAKKLEGESYANIFLEAQLNAIERLSIPMKFINMDEEDLVGLLLWDLFDPDLTQLSEGGKARVTEYRKMIREDWIRLYKEKEVPEPERRFIQMADLHKVVQRVAIDYCEDFHVFRIFKLLDYDALIDDILGLPTELRFSKYKSYAG
ncbi:hypothetical protein PMAYCL1PPCAC_17773, partial [Pristionchus mayeri]